VPPGREGGVGVISAAGRRVDVEDGSEVEQPTLGAERVLLCVGWEGRAEARRKTLDRMERWWVLGNLPSLGVGLSLGFGGTGGGEGSW
jgi:hypothetical protein